MDEEWTEGEWKRRRYRGKGRKGGTDGERKVRMKGRRVELRKSKRRLRVRGAFTQVVEFLN